jgi:nucleotide-binding universal stress UspA family protein
MYENILFPYDGSDGAAAVLHHAGELAHWADGTITLLYVADTSQHSVTRVESSVVDGMVDHGTEVLESGTATLDSLDADYTTDVVQGTPAETIVDYAEEYDQDLIVMPTRGRQGLSQALLGSVTEKVVRLAETPVLTARTVEDDRLDFPYDDILLPTDGSDAAGRAVDHGLSLAASLGATAHAFSAVDTGAVGVDDSGTLTTAGESAADEAVERVAAAGDERGVDVRTHVADGSPAAAIVEAVDDIGVDAVVMGTTGRRGIERILLGSVAEKTVRSAPVPVITVGDDGTDL